MSLTGFDEVTRRIRENALDRSAPDTVDVFDSGPQHFMDPQRVGVVDGFGREDEPMKRFCFLASTDAFELHDPAVLVNFRILNRERAAGCLQLRAFGNSFITIREQLHDDFALEAVGFGDFPYF